MSIFKNKIEIILFYAIVRIQIVTGNLHLKIWRGGRAAECTGLENQQGLIALRGFKSLPLRQILKNTTNIFLVVFFVQNFVNLIQKKPSYK